MRLEDLLRGASDVDPLAMTETEKLNQALRRARPGPQSPKASGRPTISDKVRPYVDAYRQQYSPSTYAAQPATPSAYEPQDLNTEFTTPSPGLSPAEADFLDRLTRNAKRMHGQPGIRDADVIRQGAARYAGGMTPSQAIMPPKPEIRSLDDIKRWDAPERTAGAPVNYWGGDATKAGDKYYSAPPVRTASYERETNLPYASFADWKAKTAGQKSHGGLYMPGYANDDGTPSATPWSPVGKPGINTAKFEDHMAAVDELAARKSRRNPRVVARATALADDRRERLQARRDRIAGMSPQQRMMKEALRGGGELSPLQLAMMGQGDLAQTVARGQSDVKAAEVMAGGKQKKDEQDPLYMADYLKLADMPEGPAKNKALAEIERRRDIRKNGVTAPAVSMSPLEEVKSAIRDDPTILDDFSKFERFVRSRGITTPSEIGSLWRDHTGRDPRRGFWDWITGAPNEYATPVNTTVSPVPTEEIGMLTPEEIAMIHRARQAKTTRPVPGAVGPLPRMFPF